MLREIYPDFKSDKGKHYAEILETLYKHSLRKLHKESSARQHRKKNG